MIDLIALGNAGAVSLFFVIAYTVISLQSQAINRKIQIRIYPAIEKCGRWISQLSPSVTSTGA